MTRSNMRGAAVFAATAAMAAGLLLSGCGAGQVTQTESQNPPISGVNINSADGKVHLRNVAFQYNGPAGYKSGTPVPLQVRIINENLNAIRLVGVTSDAGAVVLAGRGVTPPAPATPTTTPPAPSASGSASGAPAASGSPSGSAPVSGSPSGSASASASASATPSGPPTNPTINVEIPVRGLAVLDPGAERYLQITGLSEELKPGDTIELTFRFDNGVSITTPVPVAIPGTPPARTPMEFEGGEEEGH